MAINEIDFHLSTNHSSRGLSVEKMAADEDDCSALFINYATIAWHEMRRAWRGEQIAPKRKPRDPMRRSSKEELLSSTVPFEEPVPLSKMVEFLVEVWEEDLQD